MIDLVKGTNIDEYVMGATVAVMIVYGAYRFAPITTAIALPALSLLVVALLIYLRTNDIPVPKIVNSPGVGDVKIIR